MIKYLVYQIYYDKESRSNCLPFFIPYYNKDCSPFFENSVILDLIDQSVNSEYFGVLSHRLKYKMNYYPNTRDNIPFGPEYLEALKCDILFLQDNKGNMLQQLDDWHAGALKDLRNILKQVGEKVGINWVNKTGLIKNVIYSNHFIARSEIYRDYVDTLLRPAVEVMQDMKELWRPSGYRNLGKVLPEELQLRWDVKDYPLHTFLCERLFSIYLQDKHFNIKKV